MQSVFDPECFSSREQCLIEFDWQFTDAIIYICIVGSFDEILDNPVDLNPRNRDHSLRPAITKPERAFTFQEKPSKLTRKQFA